jgi:hypothetical protein
MSQELTRVDESGKSAEEAWRGLYIKVYIIYIMRHSKKEG